KLILDPQAPLGSLVYAKTFDDQLGSVSDVDQFNFIVDPGTIISADLLSNGGMQGRIDILAADGTTILASASSAGVGLDTALQNVTVTDGGNVMVLVSSLQGSGDYQLRLAVGAELEDEGATANGSIATALNLDGSGVTIPDLGTRDAVLGTFDTDGDQDYFS